MSTIGHPLSDFINAITPFLTAAGAPDGQDGFKPGATPGLPNQEQVIEWYAEVAGWNPALDLPWGAAFGMFRNSVIMQGIAARYALRQASSAKAKDYADMMGPFAEFAWTFVERAKDAVAKKSKL
jgi:aminoglycoside phosphotransferase (APT) family kinase protein